MIRSLHIENYALIEQLDIDLHKGFSVITGETGAGKSILLGAIGLLRGQRADSHAIKKGAKRCIVEAIFDVSQYGMESFFLSHDLDYEDGECIIRRELTSGGKSRGFINDTPVSLNLLRELGDMLIDVHSQHQNLLLGKEEFQLSVLDIMSGSKSLLYDYRQEYNKLCSLRQQLQEKISLAEKNKEEEDYIRFQVEQLAEASLHEGEQSLLEQESEILSHAENIKQELYRARHCIENDNDEGDLLQMLRTASSILGGVSDKLLQAGELAERLDSCAIEIKDIADEIEQQCDHVECNPERLSVVNERLNLIYSLEQKHHVETVEELLSLQKELEERLTIIDNSDEFIQRLQRECDSQQRATVQKAKQLSQMRCQSAQMVEERIVESLRPLGMPNIRFCVRVVFDANRLSLNGGDDVSFLFSANKNDDLNNIAQVASGGEIARVMLSLKVLIASAVKLPTIIFDEIDTGVSGRIAEKMARMMKMMGEQNRQVISITHLPQIAAMGTSHYKVYKEDNADTTTSHIVELSLQQRIEEIAHMLSGERITEAALDNARALLENGSNMQLSNNI